MTDDLARMRKALLDWHDANARDLPWRGEKDPYRIWLSEIMLQQTRTEAASGYYRAFLRAYPDVFSLADAADDDVMKLWEGLGYYSRARNLLRAARVVAREKNGVFPDTARELQKLPGIGEYTAGAVASMAYQKPEPAVDANQIRVLCRIFDISGDVSRAAVKAQIRASALELIDRNRPGDFNQALMGLGAMICLPRPNCAGCPVAGMCRAKARGAQSEIPVMPEKAARRVEDRAVALVFCKGRVLVRRRPAKGLLAGLWEFPGFPGARTVEEVREALCEAGVSRTKYIGDAGEAEHAFTHLLWRMRGYILETDAENGLCFADAAALDALAMPSALRVFRAEAQRRLTP